MGRAFNYVRGASLEQRFWSKVDIKGATDCWEWQASLGTGGYGNFGVPRNDGTGRFVMKRAHRIAWELVNGPLAGSHVLLCHKCDNPKCVNPAHLFQGDHLINMRDCIDKGRLNSRVGECNPRSKLTENDVRAIRGSNLSLRELADQYGVVKSVVAYARRGKTWAHL